MLTRLPDYVDPWHLADCRKSFSGQIPLSRLSRLSNEVAEPSGKLDFQLNFGRDAQGHAWVKCWVKTTLLLRCQRCLEAFEYPVDNEISLGLVEGLEEAERLPKGYDPLWLETPRVRLVDIAEDEVLLALPQVPLHGTDECAPTAEWNSDGLSPSDTSRDNPFTGLGDLVQKLK